MKQMKPIILACSILAVPSLVSAAANSQSISFQPGVDGYGGLVERLISTQTSSERPSIAVPTPENWFLDGGTPDQQALQRWENIVGAAPNQIPAGATILNARLVVTTGGGNDHQTGGYYGVAGLTGKMADFTQPGFPLVTRHFDNTTTYVNYNAGGPNFENGKGTFVNRPVGSFQDPLSNELDGDSVIDQNQVVSANVTSLVQRWVRDPSSNFGLAIQAGVPAATTDGWAIGTQWNADATRRPKLEVTYTTDEIETHSFQQGVNGYTGAVSAWVRVDNNVANPFNGAEIGQAFLDGPAANSPDDQGLFRFNNLFSDEGGSIDRDAEVVDAYFVLTTGDTSTNSRSPGGFDVAAVLRDWDTDITNTDKPSLYSEWSNGFGPSADDPDGNGNVDLGASLGRFFGMTHGQVMPMDITELFKKWQSGELENYGLNVQSYNTADGWQVAFDGAADASTRPQLMVRTLLPTGRWTADANGTWTANANWLDSKVANGRGQVAIFGNVITAARTVTLDAAQTVGQLRFDSTFSYTIAGSNGLTLDRSAGDAIVQVLRGNHTISAPITFARSTTLDVAATSNLSLTGSISASGVAVNKTGAGSVDLPGLRAASLAINAGTVRMTPANTNAAVSVVGALSIATGAKLDLTDNALVLDYATGGTSPIADLHAAAKAGGLISSTAASNFAVGIVDGSAIAGGTFAGITLDADAVVIDLTLKGDTNLNYTVNFDDLLALAQNYDAAGTGKLWSNGDSNYDGVVNFDDLLALAQNYGSSALDTSQMLASAGISESFVADWALARALTPEPTALAALSLLIPAGRRRR